MTDGFLGYNASFMLDVVVCALLLVAPALLYSVYEVKFRRHYVRHRNLQVTLGAVLLVTVVAFEVDLQIVHNGWESIVTAARPTLSEADLVRIRGVLWIHLVFAISTPLLWIVTLTLAWKRFPSPPAPSAHSRLHKTLGWISTGDLLLTSATGLLFYYVAFIA